MHDVLCKEYLFFRLLILLDRHVNRRRDIVIWFHGVIDRENLVVSAQIRILVPRSIAHFPLQLFLHHLVGLAVGNAVHFSFIGFSLQPVQLLSTIWLGESQQAEGVHNNIWLYFVVKVAVRCKRGRLVDFQEPRFSHLVDHNVKAEDLKADLEGAVIGKICAIIVD